MHNDLRAFPPPPQHLIRLARGAVLGQLIRQPLQEYRLQNSWPVVENFYGFAR